MERINTAAARAINALDESEARAFDEMAQQDAYLADHVDSFRRVAIELVDGLPEIVPVASPEIWDRIASETGIYSPSSETAAPALSNAVPLRRRGRNTFLAIASVAAALIFGIAVGGVIDRSDPSMQEMALAAAADAGSTTLTMTNPAGATDITAEVVLAADGTGYVMAESLPRLNDDRTYQLWVIVDDQVISAGLLGNDPGVMQFRAEGNIVGMAISNEVAGGVVVSEVDPTTLWLQDA